MSKLLQRLSDAARSGVYRASGAGDIVEAVRGSALRVARIRLAGATEKKALLQCFARALAFPEWFGGNWDALEDCLSDLSWSDAGGYVLLVEDAEKLPADERGVLSDILASAASSWKDRGRPFFAVFVGGDLPFPEL